MGPRMNPLVQGDIIDGMSVSKTTQKDEPKILSGPTKKKTPLRVRIFIDVYAQNGNLSAAAKAANISPWMHYHRLKKDPVYRERFEQAQDLIGQELENLAIDRVRNGVKRQLFWRDKPMRQNGRLVYETQYDTQLHVTMLKRFRPKLYRDVVQQEHSGSINLVERLEAARARLLAMRRQEDEKKTG
jgi:hypothetical protein